MKNTACVKSVVMLVAMFTLSSCDWYKKKGPEVVASEVVQKETVQEEPKLRLVDVNSDEVYKDAHIPGATHLSLDRLEEAATGWNKKTPIVVYCSDYTCTASHIAAKKFTDLGFEDVAVYSGGMNEWFKMSKENKATYPLEGEAKQSYLEKSVEKVLPKEEGLKTISSEDLSKRLEDLKK